MNWCILIPLLVGVLCALLGYLLGKLFGRGSEVDVNGYKNQIARLEKDLEACRASKAVAPVSSTSLGATTTTAFAATAIAYNADEAFAVFGKKIKENDLTIVEGVGPKIQELFHDRGVKTWKALSECSVAKCQQVLESGGERFKVHNPGTWPDQAKLAYEGKWAELLKWQDELDGGK